MSMIVKRMFPLTSALQEKIKKAMPPKQTETSTKKAAFAVLTDEADPHGFSIFLSAIHSIYISTAETAIVSTVPEKLSYVATAAKLIGRLSALFVTDLPVDASSEEKTARVLRAYQKLAEAIPEETRIIFLDHHKAYQHIIDGLKEAGVEVHITNGISMTLTLAEAFKQGIIKFFEPEEAVKYVADNLATLLRDPTTCVMLAGNRADMDVSVAELYRRVGRIAELDYIAEGLSWLVDTMRYRLAEVPLGGICSHAEQVGRMIDEGKLPWPPRQYANVLAIHGEVVGRVLLYRFDPSTIPDTWINRTAAYYLDSDDAREKGIDFVISYGVGKPPRQTSGKAITIAVYARWYSNVNLRPILLKIAEELNREGKGEWRVFGHPTFSIMLKYLPENADDDEAWKEAKNVAEMIAEQLNELK